MGADTQYTKEVGHGWTGPRSTRHSVGHSFRSLENGLLWGHMATIDAPFRIALTGTPVENNVGDLWSIMELLNPGFLGTQASFRQRFFIPILYRVGRSR